MPWDLRGSKLCLSTLAILALGVLLPRCDSSKNTAKAKDAPVLGGTAKQSVSSRVTVHSGGLAITLTAMPTRAKIGSTVKFEVTASEAYALGALGYQLRSRLDGAGDRDGRGMDTVVRSVLRNPSRPKRPTTPAPTPGPAPISRR